MGRRDQNDFQNIKDFSSNSEQKQIIINTEKIAIIDADILFHWALNFASENNASLEEAKQEVEKVILNFENS